MHQCAQNGNTYVLLTGFGNTFALSMTDWRVPTLSRSSAKGGISRVSPDQFSEIQKGRYKELHVSASQESKRILRESVELNEAAPAQGTARAQIDPSP
jgi:hypothetical protein